MAERKANKKVFVFPHLDLINFFLKDEAATTCNNESNIVQDLILSHYLNDNSDIAYSVYAYLFNGDNGLVRAGKSLFSQFAALPEYIDDSALPLIDFFRKLEREYPTNLNKVRMNLTHFMRSIGALRDVFGYYCSRDEYTVTTSAGQVLKLYDLSYELKAFDELLEVFRKGDQSYPSDDISVILDMIYRYWLLPLPDGRLLRNYTFLYRFLSDLMDLAHYPSTPEFRFQFVRIAKHINFFDSATIG